MASDVFPHGSAFVLIWGQDLFLNESEIFLGRKVGFSLNPCVLLSIARFHVIHSVSGTGLQFCKDWVERMFCFFSV